MSESIYNDDPFHLFGTFLSTGDITAGKKKRQSSCLHGAYIPVGEKGNIYKDVSEVRDYTMRISKEKEFYHWKQ